MIIKEAGTGPGMVKVTFQLPASIWAETVHLAGDFNGWDRRSHPLERSKGEEVWQIALELESGKPYQFRYLINGTHWQNDWKADRYVPNPFGGDNSVLET